MLIEGKISGKDFNILIIVSRFNETITSNLLSGAKKCLLEYGCKEETIDIAYVPGAFELPYAAKAAALAHKYTGIISIGCVIRGETPHFKYIASEAARGIASVSLEENIPITFGVLTTDDMAQAIARSQPDGTNKGYDAAYALLELINVCQRLNK